MQGSQGSKTVFLNISNSCIYVEVFLKIPSNPMSKCKSVSISSFPCGFTLSDALSQVDTKPMQTSILHIFLVRYFEILLFFSLYWYVLLTSGKESYVLLGSEFLSFMTEFFCYTSQQSLTSLMACFIYHTPASLFGCVICTWVINFPCVLCVKVLKFSIKKCASLNMNRWF